MNSNTFRIIFAIFLIAHGLVTMSLATVPAPQPGALRTPFFPAWWNANVDAKWPASNLGLSEVVVRTAGWILWLAALIGFVLAGVGLLGVPGLHGIWREFIDCGSSVYHLAGLLLAHLAGGWFTT